MELKQIGEFPKHVPRPLHPDVKPSDKLFLEQLDVLQQDVRELIQISVMAYNMGVQTEKTIRERPTRTLSLIHYVVVIIALLLGIWANLHK